MRCSKKAPPAASFPPLGQAGDMNMAFVQQVLQMVAGQRLPQASNNSGDQLRIQLLTPRLADQGAASSGSALSGAASSHAGFTSAASNPSALTGSASSGAALTSAASSGAALTDVASSGAASNGAALTGVASSDAFSSHAAVRKTEASVEDVTKDILDAMSEKTVETSAKNKAKSKAKAKAKSKSLVKSGDKGKKATLPVAKAGLKPSGGLGCSKCRWAVKGCGKCRAKAGPE